MLSNIALLRLQPLHVVSQYPSVNYGVACIIQWQTYWKPLALNIPPTDGLAEIIFSSMLGNTTKYIRYILHTIMVFFFYISNIESNIMHREL